MQMKKINELQKNLDRKLLPNQKVDQNEEQNSLLS